MSQLEELKTCHFNPAVLKKAKGWGGGGGGLKVQTQCHIRIQINYNPLFIDPQVLL